MRSQGARFAALEAAYRARRQLLEIVCSTTEAAAEVLLLLSLAGLHPVDAFELRPLFSTMPPITFIMRVSLTATQVRKIRAIADTTVSE
jgi:hypothetical protein